MKGLILATSIAAFVSIETVSLQAQTRTGGASDPRCMPPLDPESREYVIDAAAGTVTGLRRFKLNDQVRVFVKNLNPFRYSYVLTLNEELVAEPPIGDFLKFVGVPDVSPPADSKKLEAQTSSLVARRKPSSDCDINELSSIAQEIVGSRTAADQRLAAVAKEMKTLAEAVTAHQKELQNDTAVCDALVRHATNLVAAVSNSKPDFDTARASIDALSVGAARVADYKRRYPKCQDDLLKTLESMTADHHKAVIPKLRDDLRKQEEAKAKLDQVAKGIDTTLRTRPFYVLRFAGDYDLPTNVNLTLKRQDVTNEGAPVETVLERRLNFGGRARFALGGGLAFSQLDNLSFQRVQGFIRDSDGAVLPGQTATVPVVGLTEQSSSRIVPMVVLHGRLVEIVPRVGLHLTAGATAKTDDLGTDIEYLLGPSFSFAEERLFVTVGAYGGRLQVLEGDLYVGARVQEDLAEIPVRKDRRWDLGIALTYKLR